MRATDIIRGVLDLIDKIECQELPPAEESGPVDDVKTGVDSNRFQQIVDLLTSEYDQMYDNSPASVVADISSVTTHAGGGVNGPKNPADLRSNSISMFPNYQAENKG